MYTYRAVKAANCDDLWMVVWVNECGGRGCFMQVKTEAEAIDWARTMNHGVEPIVER